MSPLRAESQRDRQYSVSILRGRGGRPPQARGVPTPTSVIVDYIDEYRNRFGVDPICTVLRQAGIEIAPSTYYAAKKRGTLSAAALEETYAANTVHQLHVANRRLYGVRKVWHAMKSAGHQWAVIRSAG